MTQDRYLFGAVVVIGDSNMPVAMSAAVPLDRVAEAYEKAMLLHPRLSPEAYEWRDPPEAELLAAGYTHSPECKCGEVVDPADWLAWFINQGDPAADVKVERLHLLNSNLKRERGYAVFGGCL